MQMICMSELVMKIGNSSRPSMLTWTTGVRPGMGCSCTGSPPISAPASTSRPLS